MARYQFPKTCPKLPLHSVVKTRTKTDISMASWGSDACDPKAGFRFLVEPSQSRAQVGVGAVLSEGSRAGLRSPVETGLWKKKCRWSLTVRCWKETD